MIYVKVVEKTKGTWENVDLKDLTHFGLTNVIYQAKQLIQEVEDLRDGVDEE